MHLGLLEMNTCLSEPLSGCLSSEMGEDARPFVFCCEESSRIWEGLRDFKQEIRRLKGVQRVLAFFLRIRKQEQKEVELGKKEKSKRV